MTIRVHWRRRWHRLLASLLCRRGCTIVSVVPGFPYVRCIHCHTVWTLPT